MAKNSAKDLSQKLSLVLKAQCDLNLTKGHKSIEIITVPKGFKNVSEASGVSDSETQANAVCYTKCSNLRLV